MSSSTKLLISIRPSLYRELFTSEMDAQLHDKVQVMYQAEDRNMISAELADRITGFDAVLTGWGTPQFTDDVLKNAEQLKLIAHSAGSIKRMLPSAVFEHGIRVTHVASALAPSVAETTLMFIMLCLRQIHKVDYAFKHESWESARSIAMGHELAGRRIGVVGAGYTGRHVIRLLNAMNTELWVYDPYLSSEDAEKLGVKKVDLESLLKECPIVTLQAPSTDETYRMIGAERFSLLQDGAIFINTARTHLIDESALLAELQSGRIMAALDVFEQEPLPNDSAFRRLDNVIITPHIAAITPESRQRQGQYAIDEIIRFFKDGSLHYEVTRDMLNVMA